MPKFSKKPSYVNYRRAKILTKAELQKQFDAALYTSFSNVSAPLLKQLQQGLIVKDQTPRGIKQFARELLGR